jgi:GNAT superfamily N-acetyltransferase
MTIKRTSGSDPDFLLLITKSDAFYRDQFGDGMDYFEPFNKVDPNTNALVLYDDNIPIACGAFRQFDHETVEIKRMYVLPDKRKKGVATKVLLELEQWAKENGYTASTLETSISLKDAISLYQKQGYTPIENWGQYIGIETSICLRKKLC